MNDDPEYRGLKETPIWRWVIEWYRLQVQFAWRGGYHNDVGGGLDMIGIPFDIAPLLFAGAAVAALCVKSISPLSGTAIGLFLSYPLSFAIALLAALVNQVCPWLGEPLVFVAGSGLVVGGFWTKPDDRKTTFQPPGPSDGQARA